MKDQSVLKSYGGIAKCVTTSTRTTILMIIYLLKKEQ